MRRTSQYDKDLSKRLQKPGYAQGFIEALMGGEEPMTYPEAVKETISVMGLTEFQKMSGIPKSNIQHYLDSLETPKLVAQEKISAPFGFEPQLIFVKKNPMKRRSSYLLDKRQ